MSNVTRDAESMPVETPGDSPDSEVIEFRAGFEERSPLDELVRQGAQQMLQSAIEAEVAEFIAGHSGKTDEDGRRLVVRNGALPEREILTGAGKLAIRQPRVRDRSPEHQQKAIRLPQGYGHSVRLRRGRVKAS